MLVQRIGVSIEEFDRIVALPENAERLLELIDGEISEVVSNNLSSIIAAYICAVITVFVRQHKLGYVSGAGGGYQIGNERYIPDCAFISKTRLPNPTMESYVSVPPDLVVEVLSPCNTPDEMTVKVDNYLRAGVVVWVVSPEAQRVVVHHPDYVPKIYNITDTLDGGSVLPGFTLPVHDIFAE